MERQLQSTELKEPEKLDCGVSLIEARGASSLRCVYCHDDARRGGLRVANCPECQVCYHIDCREQFTGKRSCPTLGCGAVLKDEWNQNEAIPGPPITNRGSRGGLLISLLGIGALTLSSALALIFTLGLMTSFLYFGAWLNSFEVTGFQVIGLLFALGAFIQAPFAYYYASVWLYERTRPRWE